VTVTSVLQTGGKRPVMRMTKFLVHFPDHETKIGEELELEDVLEFTQCDSDIESIEVIYD